MDKMTTEGGETAQDKEDADSYSLFANSRRSSSVGNRILWSSI